jgi:hypothetical protein
MEGWRSRRHPVQGIKASKKGEGEKVFKGEVMFNSESKRVDD